MRIPKLSLHPSGHWRVRINGKSFYLGKDKGQAEKEYSSLILEHFGSTRRTGVVTVAALLRQFEKDYLDSVSAKWRKTKQHILKQALSVAIEQFGNRDIEDFGPLAFQQVRKKMASIGKRSVAYVNGLCAMLKAAFRWGVSHELVSQQCYDRLLSVPGLKPGQLGLSDGRKVKPVTDEQIAAVLPFLSNRIADIVRLLALTGARPGEVLGMRPVEITKDGSGGFYEPEHHKTEWKNCKRVIRLNADAMAILNSRWPESPFLYFFPMRWNKAKPMDTQSLKNEIHKACKRSMLPKFNPYQIRHTVLTKISLAKGIESAQSIGGHAQAIMTAHYDHSQKERAKMALG